jgi:hypothetical protein
MSNHIFFVPLLINFLLLGCTTDFDGNTSEWMGRYKFEDANIIQEVEITIDGVFSNTLFVGRRRVWQDSGTWELESLPALTGFIFSKFRFGISGHSAQLGYWFVVPEKSYFGQKRLCFDPDLNRCFVRSK